MKTATRLLQLNIFNDLFTLMLLFCVAINNTRNVLYIVIIPVVMEIKTYYFFILEYCYGNILSFIWKQWFQNLVLQFDLRDSLEILKQIYMETCLIRTLNKLKTLLSEPEYIKTLFKPVTRFLKSQVWKLSNLTFLFLTPKIINFLSVTRFEKFILCQI